MAEIVAAFGVPHTPTFPGLVAWEPTCEVARLYSEVAQHLKAVQPDVLVVFDSDHLNTFFFNNLPTFAIGVAERASGPNDATRMPRYDVPVCFDLSGHVHQRGIIDGFDLSMTQEFEFDHSVMVPLHFLTPMMNIPVVPIFINGLAPPLPGAKRCYALGQMVRSAMKDWPAKTRLSGEVGKLHDLGAHAYLLSHLSRFELFGLTVLTYSERMGAAMRQ